MASRIEVSIPIFSGRPDPYFTIEEQNDIATIYDKVSNLFQPKSDMDPRCSNLGSGSFLLTFYSKEKVISLYACV